MTSQTSKQEPKQEMLRRIRTANGSETNLAAAASEWKLIPRAFHRGGETNQELLLALLTDRLRDYDAEVERLSIQDLPDAITRVIRSRDHPPMLIAAGFSRALLPAQQDFTVDGNFAPAVLDGFGGILTEASLAIAETGTLVLQSVPGQGRRAPTLVPDFHLCVLRTSQVVETVPEAIAFLAPTATLPTTFISGPSATADIEMTRIKGVHGPRFLHVLLVDG
jgi:L-lactate dehydrogenase complex protein LldG